MWTLQTAGGDRINICDNVLERHIDTRARKAELKAIPYFFQHSNCRK